MQFKRQAAFTLAEVIITLGIIGIVAEITIPSLMNNINETQNKTAFKKAYSVASQAWLMAVTENPATFTSRGGWSCTWPTGETMDYDAVDGRADAFKEKMKVVKSCVDESGCWPDDYEYIEHLTGNNKTGLWSPYSYGWKTADGMCWSSPYKGRDESHFLVDTNCNKKPNKVGEDIFSLLLGADGVIYFYIDDITTTGKPISRGGVGPYLRDPATIGERTVSFKSWLYK